ncbi:ArsR/SmtB family transcription factor [Microbacterium ureisolvens]|uniref:ArsR/SmtB family transcription factor n=1 Tax=Microbacterium ureisolvens TaxID=2781186 RepID=UPI003636C708
MTERARPSLDELARALAEPMRLRILRELMGGTALPAGALAARIGVAPSTVSAHISRLAETGLVEIETVGRAREVRLADQSVADTVEGILRLSGEDPVSSLSAHDRRTALRRARRCYDHLAGDLAIALVDRAFSEEWIADRDGVWSLTVEAATVGDVLGVPITLDPSSRPMVRPCLDWTERRPHIAGKIGAAVLSGMLEAGWLRRRRDDRALTITPLGRDRLSALGIDAA